MKCWKCGKEDATYSTVVEESMFYDVIDETVTERNRLKLKRYSDGVHVSQRMFCKECFQKYTENLNKRRDEYARLKKSLMLERAVRMLERQAVDIYDYKDIIDQFEEYVEEKPEKFDSSHEMVAAIVLIHSGIRLKPQYKLLGYRLDFLIPDLKMVLEIDGELHSNNTLRDNNRDIKVREELGAEWETVRISTKYLERNAPALLDAMIAVKAEKQKLRAKHHGYLPEWYTARRKPRKKTTIGDDKLLEI